MKIITVCGSLRFKDQIIESALRLELKRNAVITPVFSNNMDKDAFTEDEIKTLNNMHKEKIKLSDAIYVVDVDGYIGKQTKAEIEYAKSLGKEMIYYSKDNIGKHKRICHRIITIDDVSRSPEIVVNDDYDKLEKTKESLKKNYGLKIKNVVSKIIIEYTNMIWEYVLYVGSYKKTSRTLNILKDWCELETLIQEDLKMIGALNLYEDLISSLKKDEPFSYSDNKNI